MRIFFKDENILYWACLYLNIASEKVERLSRILSLSKYLKEYLLLFLFSACISICIVMVFLQGNVLLGEHLGKHLDRTCELLKNVSIRLYFVFMIFSLLSWFLPSNCHNFHDFCRSFVMILLILSGRPGMIFSNFRITVKAENLLIYLQNLIQK